ncbi:hypothetical protein Barb6_00733 [Bacteroidales bacterium Barb6]|nr:hypothetical protein Barb6_00733 [Bacteroidales bacterium Barb6]
MNGLSMVFTTILVVQIICVIFLRTERGKEWIKHLDD